METKRASAKTPPPSLPHDLVADVLSRLPVLSILRFRAACKHWFSLTHGRSFIDEHRRRSTRRSSVLIPNLSFDSQPKTLVLTKFSLQEGSLGEEEVVSFPNTFNPFYPHETIPIAYPSCSNAVNGLVCLHDALSCCVLNPFTGRSSALPRIPNCACIHYLALGYDQSTDVYKVLARNEPLSYEHGRARWAVCSVGTAEWRFIDDCDTSYMPHCGKYAATALLNGALFFPASNHKDENIFSFAVKDEKFQMIPTPSKYYSLGLTVLLSGDSKDYLCYMGTNLCRTEDVLDVFVFEANHTWINLYSIDLYSIDTNSMVFYICIVGMLDGNLLMAASKTLLRYDMKSRTIETIGKFSYAPWNTIYNESLISPRNGMEEVLPI